MGDSILGVILLYMAYASISCFSQVGKELSYFLWVYRVNYIILNFGTSTHYLCSLSFHAVATVSFSEKSYTVLEGEELNITVSRGGNNDTTAVVLVASDSLAGTVQGNNGVCCNNRRLFYPILRSA